MNFMPRLRSNKKEFLIEKNSHENEKRSQKSYWSFRAICGSQKSHTKRTKKTYHIRWQPRKPPCIKTDSFVVCLICFPPSINLQQKVWTVAVIWWFLHQLFLHLFFLMWRRVFDWKFSIRFHTFTFFTSAKCYALLGSIIITHFSTIFLFFLCFSPLWNILIVSGEFSTWFVKARKWDDGAWKIFRRNLIRLTVNIPGLTVDAEKVASTLGTG